MLAVEITTQQKATLQVEDRSAGVLRADPLRAVVEGQLGKKGRVEGGTRRRRLERESWLRRRGLQAETELLRDLEPRQRRQIQERGERLPDLLLRDLQLARTPKKRKPGEISPRVELQRTDSLGKDDQTQGLLRGRLGGRFGAWENQHRIGQRNALTVALQSSAQPSHIGPVHLEMEGQMPWASPIPPQRPHTAGRAAIPPTESAPCAEVWEGRIVELVR